MKNSDSENKLSKSILNKKSWYQSGNDSESFLQLLQEEVYMEARPGFTSGFSKNEGCMLRKALYGLKQSPRAWFGRFTSAMKIFGYRQSNSDHTMFLRRRGRRITCLIIYVDDMIITGMTEKK